MKDIELIDYLALLTQAIHEVERNFNENEFCYDLPSSINDRIEAHLEHARMYAGDLLRLATLKADHRQPVFFDVGKYGGRFTNSINIYDDPMPFVKWAKNELREILYSFCDNPLSTPIGVSVPEMNLYFEGLLQHLKEADQCFGLWLGYLHEINNKKSAIPKKDLFDAIISDLGEPLLIGQNKEPMYNAEWVKSILSRHLGIGLQSSIVNRQS